MITLSRPDMTDIVFKTFQEAIAFLLSSLNLHRSAAGLDKITISFGTDDAP